MRITDCANQGDLKFVVARQLSLSLTSLCGTNFQGADLTDANFTNATLKSANFNEATLTRANFTGATHLDKANPGNTYLTHFPLLKLLTDPTSGYEIDLSGQNLRGVYLANANLEGANLTNTDLAEADLTNANLKNANLREANCIGTNFTRATLTGACLEAWNIDPTTTFKDIDCDFVFLLEQASRNGSRERRPHDPSNNFQPGDFEKLFSEATNLVELLIRDGLDPQAFGATFQELMDKFDITPADIQSIQKKGNDVLVTVEVPDDTDKADFERTALSSYEAKIAQLTAERDAARLEADTAKQHSQDILGLAKSFANQPIEIKQEITQNPTISQESGRQIDMGDHSNYGETNVSDQGQVAGRDIVNDRDPDTRETPDR